MVTMEVVESGKCEIISAFRESFLTFLFFHRSAVVTIFCCFAEDPQALQRNSPRLYKKLKKTYEERCTLFN